MTDTKNYMYKSWWKIASVVLLVYTFTAGLLLEVPRLPALQETIRNLYFHVCMWFAMMILFTVSVVNAVRYLRTFNIKYDIYARQFAVVAIVFGLLGYLTGAIWASYTWVQTILDFLKTPQKRLRFGTKIKSWQMLFGPSENFNQM